MKSMAGGAVVAGISMVLFVLAQNQSGSDK